MSSSEAGEELRKAWDELMYQIKLALPDKIKSFIDFKERE